MSDQNEDTKDRLTRRMAAIDELLTSDHRDARFDSLLGEVVGILVRLDKAGFAKVYATVKAEEAAMNDRHRTDMRDLLRRRDSDAAPSRSLDVVGTEGGKVTTEKITPS
jgi:hypothetical protein